MWPFADAAADTHHESGCRRPRLRLWSGMHHHARIAQGGTLDGVFTRKGGAEEQAAGRRQSAFRVDAVGKLVGDMPQERLGQSTVATPEPLHHIVRIASAAPSSSGSSKNALEYVGFDPFAGFLLIESLMTRDENASDDARRIGRDARTWLPANEARLSSSVIAGRPGGVPGVLHGREESERRLGSLVAIRLPVPLQAIEASTGLRGIPHDGLCRVIVTEKPIGCSRGSVPPPLVTVDRVRAGTRIGERRRLNGLLIEPRTPVLGTTAADGVTERCPSRVSRSSSHSRSSNPPLQQRRTLEGGAGRDDRLGECRVGVGEAWLGPRPPGVLAGLGHCVGGVGQQAAGGHVVGIGAQQLGGTERRKGHCPRPRRALPHPSVRALGGTPGVSHRRHCGRRRSPVPRWSCPNSHRAPERPPTLQLRFIRFRHFPADPGLAEETEDSASRGSSLPRLGLVRGWRPRAAGPCRRCSSRARVWAH